MPSRFHIAIIDCAIKTPSTGCFNRLVYQYPEIQFTLHSVPFFGVSCIDNADAYIVLGSYSNVCDRLDWQSELAQLIINKLNQKIPILGICFTHQLMADAFGSKVDYVKDENFSFHGVRKIQIKPNRLNLTMKDLKIFKSHSYEVKSIPTDFNLIANSDECSIEGLEHKELPYFSFQGHPEASQYFVDSAITAHLINPLSKEEFTSAQLGGDKILNAFIEFAQRH